MSNNSKEILYIEYKLKGPSNFKKEHEDTTKMKIKGTIVGTFKKQAGISDKEYKEFEKKHLVEINKIKEKCNPDRKAGFEKESKLHGKVAFYYWYKKQQQSCGYCGISQEELCELFPREGGKKLPLNKKQDGKRQKRSSGTLEVEKRDSDKEYNEKNCILACPLCNNAKSNLIDEESWMSLFVNPMREYYKKLLGKDLEKQKPEKLPAK